MLRRMAAAEGPVPELLEEFRQRYGELEPEERIALFAWMALELEVSRDEITEPLERVLSARGEDPLQVGQRLNELREAIRSPRRLALERFLNVAGGLEFILQLRAEVLEAQRAGKAGLDLLEADISRLLNRWFKQGFLFLEEINQSSAFSKIRFLKERELVHPMLSLEEMGWRLGEDRMCFALYHCVMPEEPVVFIEIALTRGLVRSIHDIIDARGPARGAAGKADTAIFYSINNTQNGLAGLGLGKVLILRVLEALKQRHPGLRTFATLSPIPGLLGCYLLPILRGDEVSYRLTREAMLDDISEAGRDAILGRYGAQEPTDLAGALCDLLRDPAWIDDAVLVRHLRKPLCEWAHTHVAEERDARGKYLNPVANFHLGNGASIARRNVNFGANHYRHGMEESCGMMVNYVYSTTTLRQVGRTLAALLPWSGGGR
jgi:hypothetical protein